MPTRSDRARRGNLPAALTSFVGRRRELTEAKRLLGTSRLVTLAGPGGAGKTRLALEVAADLQRTFRDGAWLVDLADLRNPTLLPDTVADRLGLRDLSARAPLETLVAHLREREALLVLDNCEHLVEPCARLVERLLTSCPELRVLATSRQSLAIHGEALLSLGPLPTPVSEEVGSADRSLTYDAVRLFAERASAALNSFAVDDGNVETVARLCRRLDGLPLAIELAAVRVRSLSPAQIEERLEERYQLLTTGSRAAPSRQQTLRSLVDWSWELCSAEERLLWARASVFSGGFELDAVESVCSGDGLAPGDILDLVDSLTDKSLVMPEEQDGRVRYRLLETIREYGAERLVESGEDKRVRGRHRDWCHDLVARFAREWLGPGQVTWVERLRREHPNIRVALDHCLERPEEGACGLSIATHLDDYWGIRGLYTELRRWLAEALPVFPEPTAARAAAMRMGGWFALMQGDLDDGVPLLVQAGDLAEQLGDEAEAAYVEHAWGMAALFGGDVAKAAAHLADASRRFEEAGDLRGALFSRIILGLTWGSSGQPERGLAMLEETVSDCARMGEVYWRSYALWSMAHVEVLAGSVVRAEAAGKEALALQRPIDNRLVIAFALENLAWVAARQERHERAARLFGAAGRVWTALGAGPGNYGLFGHRHEQHLQMSRVVLGEQRFDTLLRDGHALAHEDALDLALETEQAGRGAGASVDDGPEGSEPLTPREREIAGLVAEGLTNREIAARLVISSRTAEGHVQNILTKLAFTSRAQIAAWVAGEQS